jgi:ABC-type transport system involved in multi-copper enzyme maturation permease subunit
MIRKKRSKNKPIAFWIFIISLILWILLLVIWFFSGLFTKMTTKVMYGAPVYRTRLE